MPVKSGDFWDWAAVTGRSELPGMGAGNQTWSSLSAASTFTTESPLAPISESSLSQCPLWRNRRLSHPPWWLNLLTGAWDRSWLHPYRNPDIPVSKKKKEKLKSAGHKAHVSTILLNHTPPPGGGGREDLVWLILYGSIFTSVKSCLFTFFPKLIPMPVLKVLSCVRSSWQL